MLAPACSTKCLSPDCGMGRVLTTTDVENVTQGGSVCPVRALRATSSMTSPDPVPKFTITQ